LDTFETILPLFDSPREEFRNFAAESFGFMIRKMKIDVFEKVLGVMISSLEDQKGADLENIIGGFSALILEAMRVSLIRKK
jgi:hypothetical protein